MLILIGLTDGLPPHGGWVLADMLGGVTLLVLSVKRSAPRRRHRHE